jgi:hypothetical protein
VPRTRDWAIQARKAHVSARLAMPLLGGQWQWPLDEAWRFYRLSPGALDSLTKAGLKLVRRHQGGVYVVWHPSTPTPPADLLLVETQAPRHWVDREDTEKPAVMAGLRRFTEPRFRGERPWARWRPAPTGEVPDA